MADNLTQGTSTTATRTLTLSRPMTSTGRATTFAGALHLAGLVAGVLSVVGVIDAPDYLHRAGEHETQVVVGALFQSAMSFAYIGVAVALYAVLRRHSPTAAAGFLGCRIAGGLLNLVGVTLLLLLLELSTRFLEAGAPASSHFQTLGALLQRGRDLTNHVAMILILGFGDGMFYWVLHRARLVPRWLSGWGFLGLALAVAASLLVLSGRLTVVTSTYMLLNAPLALQQLVLAIWLIAKGVSTRTGSPPTAASQTPTPHTTSAPEASVS